MYTTTMDLATAKSIASLINIATKPKSWTPVLEQVRCTVNPDGTLTAVATDRYAVITATYMISSMAEPFEFGISHSAAKFIAGLKADRKELLVAITLDDEGVCIHYAGQTITVAPVIGNYPPVASLIEDWKPGTDAMPVSLSLSLLSRLAKIVDVAGKKVEDWRIELAKTDNPAKPGPIKLEADRFIALQQPKLITR